MNTPRISVIIPFIIALFSTVLWAQQPQVVVSPNPLEIHGDNVEFTVKITVPGDDVLSKEGTYVVTPKLGPYKFESVRISSTTEDVGPDGITVTQEFSAPFKNKMAGKTLQIDHAYEYDEGAKEFEDITEIARCCISTGKLYMMNAQFADIRTISTTREQAATAQEQVGSPTTPTTEQTEQPGKLTKEATTPVMVIGQINFPVDNAKLPASSEAKHIEAIGEFLKENENARIEIHGYASPEGPYARNSELAGQRARSARNWLVSHLQSQGYGDYVNTANITVTSTPEDWEGFRYTISRADLSAQERQRILDLTKDQSIAENDSNEDQIFTAANGNDPLEAQLRPLRRTTITVAGEESDADLETIVVTNAYCINNVPKAELRKVYANRHYLDASQETHAAEGKVTLMSSFESTDVAATTKPAESKEVAKMPESHEMTEKMHEMHKEHMTQSEKAQKDPVKQTSSEEKTIAIKKETETGMSEAEKAYKDDLYEKDSVVLNIAQVENVYSYDIAVGSAPGVDRDSDADVGELDSDFEIYSVTFKTDGAEFDAEKYSIRYRDNLMTMESEMSDTETEEEQRLLVANNLGAVHLTLGELDNAKEYLDEAKSINPDIAELNYNYQLYYLAKGNFEKALKYAKRAEGIQGNQYNRGLAQLMTGNLTGSVTSLQAFVTEYPDIAVGHYLLAIAGARTDNSALMTKHLRRAVDINPDIGRVAEDDLEFREYWGDQLFEKARVASR